MIENEHPESTGNKMFQTAFQSGGRVKILECIMRAGEINLSAIVTETHLNHANVKEHLAALESIGLARVQHYGRICMVYFPKDNNKARAVKNLLEFWDGNGRKDQ